MRQQGLERNDWRKQQIFRYDTSYNAFMRIHSLSCGCFCPLGSRLIHGQGSLFTRACLICRCLLVETRRGLVLIDTGLGHADHQQFRLWKNLPARLLMAPKLDPSLFAVNQIRSLGFDPQDVRHIICTHLDHDHAGDWRIFSMRWSMSVMQNITLPLAGIVVFTRFAITRTRLPISLAG